MLIIRGRGKYAKWCFLISSIIWLVSQSKDFMILRKPEVDLFSMSASEITDGMRIRAEIDVVYDYFISESEVMSNGKVKAGGEDQYRYYLIPVYDESVEDTRFMAVRVYRHSYAIFDKIADITYQYLTGESPYYGTTTFLYRGKTAVVDMETYSLFDEWYRNYGFTDSSSNALVPYYLDYVNAGQTYIMTLLGFLFTVIGIIWVIVALKNKSILPKGKTEPNYEPPVYQPKYGESFYGSENRGWNAGSADSNAWNTDSTGNTWNASAENICQQSATETNDSLSLGYRNESPEKSIMSDRVDFMGSVVFRADIDNVHDLIRAGRKREALDELVLLTGMTGPQAEAVIQNWNEYYRTIR